MNTFGKNYGTYCQQLRTASGEAAGTLLRQKDRDNPAWMQQLCHRPEQTSWFSFPSFTMEDLVNGVCIAVLACLLITANSTKLTLSAVKTVFTQEQPADSISMALFEWNGENHDDH